MRPPVRLRWHVLTAGLLLVWFAKSASIGAHGGHGGVEPTFHDLQVGQQRWQIGVAVVPADPVAGEALRIETKAAALGEGGAAETPAPLDRVRVELDGKALQMAATRTPGVFAITTQAVDSGEHRLRVEVNAEGTRADSEFPLRVRPGPAARLRPILMVALILIVATIAAVMWRSPQRRTAVGIAAALLLVLSVPGSRLLANALASAFVPDRTETEVDWIPESPAAEQVPREGVAPAVNSGMRQELGPSADNAAIIARVMAAPNGVAEVVVPYPGRIVTPEGVHVTVGTRVVKGQKLTSLQPSYVMHDAIHLINTRWPILQSFIDSRRRMLESQAAAEQAKLLFADKAVSQREVEVADATARTANQEYQRWMTTLSMHDTQVKDNLPARLEVTAPIGGEIAVARFTQGQLVYEGSPLFTIVDLSTVWIEARVPEDIAQRVRRESETFVTPTFPDLTFPGKLQRVAPTVDPQSRTLSHFYAVPNPKRLLRIGMQLTAQRPPVPRLNVS